MPSNNAFMARAESTVTRVARKTSKKPKSSAKPIGIVVGSLILIVIVAAVWLTYGSGTAPSSVSTTGTSASVSTTKTLATTRVNTAITATTERISALPATPTCTGLNASQTADNNRVSAAGVKDAFYDYQFWYYPVSSQSSLSFNVVAQPKTDAYGFGPLLAVNGATAGGYWYQVGLSYNFWKYGGIHHLDGFQMFYQVYENDNAVYPYSNGSTSPINFTTLQAGNTVTLSLSFQNGNVTMQATDQQTGQSISKSYYAYGATTFIAGNPDSNTPTSLLTEWPHVLPYLCPNTTTRFVPSSGATFHGGYISTNNWNFTGYPVNEWWKPGLPGQFTMHTPVFPFTLPTNNDVYYLNYLGVGSYVESDGFFTV